VKENIAVQAEQPAAHLRAYLATALTGLPDSEREGTFALCRRLQSLCAEYGVVLYLPKTAKGGAASVVGALKVG
jgi:hypothetical protein